MFRKRNKVLLDEVRERFVTTPKANCGPMFAGILVDFDEHTLHFADVTLVPENTAVPGEIYIDRTNVAYLQRITRTEKE